jgi:hypothetical protein
MSDLGPAVRSKGRGRPPKDQRNAPAPTRNLAFLVRQSVDRETPASCRTSLIVVVATMSTLTEIQNYLPSI